ncbi:MAG: NUDIX hydrolase [Okeania sp. SIO3B5]|uniref:NUDIX hydrolase n=1 Tax=Okeania sp. SIO3B5 TaxID=2607811 RepID=UPI00140156C5|nr:NUDIX domain-containing protein [Okeania sp. SIO3B5]NEO55963.1 NUDIX hydrolase [Okeania sp. SIO3B5]
MKKLATIACVTLLVCLSVIGFAFPAHAVQTYAVAHDGSGNFFIGTKNQRGYFFCSNNSVVRAGQPLNGGGKTALPGGRLEAGTTPEQGAFDEFLEETGVLLPQQTQLSPKIYEQTGQYYGVYFRVDPQALKDINTQAARNIQEGQRAIPGIQNGTITTCNQIRNSYPLSPLDNELARGELWNFERDRQKIDALRNDRDTNWFYFILDNLRRQLRS